MDFSQFNDDDDMRQAANIVAVKSSRHMNTDSLIEPWINNNIFNNKTQRFRKQDSNKNTDKVFTERKKTTDQRIEEIYRKYSKEGISKNRDNMRVNSRQIYRQMLKQFQKAQQFKQLGPRMQQLEMQMGAESFSLEMLKKKVSPYSYAYDYKQIIMNQPLIMPQQKNIYKCSEKFQKVMKIRQRLRKKNNLTVSKQKQKYLNEYNPILLYTQRESIAEIATPAQKSSVKIRIKSQSKSFYKINQDISNNKFKIINQNSTFTTTGIQKKDYIYKNRSKFSKTRFNQTIHSFRD